MNEATQNATVTEAPATTTKAKVDPKTIPCPDGMTSTTISRTVKVKAADGKEVEQTFDFAFKPVQLQRGANVGQWYMTFDLGSDKLTEVTKDKVTALINWLGWDVFLTEIVADLNIRASKWTTESCETIKNEKNEEVVDRSSFDLDSFKEYASEYSLRGESKGELEERRQSLMEQLAVLDLDKDRDEVQVILKEVRSITRDLADKKPRTRRTKEQIAAEKAAAEAKAKEAAANLSLLNSSVS